MGFGTPLRGSFSGIERKRKKYSTKRSVVRYINLNVSIGRFNIIALTQLL